MAYTRYIIPILTMLVLLACGKGPNRPHSQNSTANAGAADEGKAGNKTPSADDTRALVQDIMAEKADCSAPSHGQASLRLLTPDEYQNSIRDILQIKADYRGQLYEPAEVNGFANNADVGTISDQRLGLYLNASQKIAEELRPNLTQVVACAETEGLSCATKVVDAIAPALWRRPLVETEKAELLTLYKSTPAPADAMTLLLMRLLTSAHFLYRSEIGTEGSLSAFELASALSYFFWGTAPDKALLDLAAAGTLREEAVLVAQAERLLADARARYFFSSFAGSWLGYKRLAGMEKDKAVFPNYNAEISGLMIAEANDTFEHIMRKGQFAELFSNNYSIGPERLAQFYKVPAKKVGEANGISFEGEGRRGFFSLGAVFASLASGNHVNPFRVGGYFMSRLLCDEPLPLPNNVNVELPEAKEGATGRDVAEAHSKQAGCAGCHIKIDGIGFALQNFDAVGVFRATENGKTIDRSGRMIGMDGAISEFEGAEGFAKVLSESRQAKRCFTLQLYRYAHGHLERKQDVCSVRNLSEQLENEKLSFAQLLVRMITHSSFTKRGP